MTCSMMHQIGYGFYWSIKKWSELRQKSFWLILWAFLFMSSCTLWVTLQDFAKWKTLRCIFVISFISIAFVVVKLKFFKLFGIDSASMKPFLGFFWPFFPKILFSFAEILTRGGLQLVFGNTEFEKYFNILYFSSNGRHPKFTVLFHFGGQFTAGKPKILLKPKISAKTTF